MNNKSILKPTIHVTLFSFAGIFLGFCNQLALAYYFGASAERDAYFAASTIPAYISAIFLGSISVVFLSRYIEVHINKSDLEATFFLSSVVNFCSCALTLIAFLGISFSNNILHLSAPGFNSNQLALSSEILKILFPTIIFQGLISIFSSVYQSNHNFIFPALPIIIGPSLTLFFVLLEHKNLGITSVAIGTLISSLLSLIILLLFLLKKGKFILRWTFRNKNLNLLLISAFPLLLAGLVFRFTSVWERLMASKLPTGSVSYLGYANQILLIMTTLTTGGIATIFFPILSRAWSEKNITTLRIYFQKGIRLILFITLPVVFLFLIVKVQLIQLFFERGAFNHTSTIAVSNSLAFMLGAFIFQSLGSIIVRAFYFMDMTIKLSIIGTIEIILYIVLSILFCKLYSYIGLAIALSLSSMINVILSSIVINKKIDIFTYNFSFDILKIVVSAIVPTIIIFLLQNILYIQNIFIVTACYCPVYLLILLYFNFEEVKTLKIKIIKLYKSYGNRKGVLQ